MLRIAVLMSLSCLMFCAAFGVGLAAANGAGRPQVIAGLLFEQLTKVENERIRNENTRHQSVINELAYRRKEAAAKLEAGLKTCVDDAKCKYAQRLDNARTLKGIDVEEQAENKHHAQAIASIKATIAAEAKYAKE